MEKKSANNISFTYRSIYLKEVGDRNACAADELKKSRHS